MLFGVMYYYVPPIYAMSTRLDFSRVHNDVSRRRKTNTSVITQINYRTL